MAIGRNPPLRPGRTVTGAADNLTSRQGFWLAACGIVLIQALLFGPSLFGDRVLLSVDLLAHDNYYLPDGAKAALAPPHNAILGDPILAYEPHRRFVAEQWRAGRLPLWNPHVYAGTPLARWEQFSPFGLIYSLFPEPRTLAWLQLLKSLLAGLGAYWLFRLSFKVRTEAAILGAWVYPISGFLVFWQLYPISNVVAWLPWMLLAADRTIHKPVGLGGPALALLTALTLLSGHVDIAGQVLLIAGLFTLARLIERYRFKPPWPALAAPLVGVLLGIAIASPYWLPLLEYIDEGARTSERQAGSEERPPTGMSDLPQVLMPSIQGSREHGDYRLSKMTRLESSAAAHAGLILTLVLVPLALLQARRRLLVMSLFGIAVLGLAWNLNLPLLVDLLRLPGLNLMSHNRLTFATGFALVALAVLGADCLLQNARIRRRWSGLAMLATGALVTWCLYRWAIPPEPIASELATSLARGKGVFGIASATELAQVQERFAQRYLVYATIASLALLSWLAIWRGWANKAWFPSLLGLLIVAELMWFARGVNPQPPRTRYYPALPAFAQLANMPSGRVLCVNCLPPNLGMTWGLNELRGYDGVDPKAMVDLLNLAKVRGKRGYRFARTLYFQPVVRWRDGAPRLSPLLDMLNLRYLVFRGAPQEGFDAILNSEGYWVAENHHALPRVFIPTRTETETDPERRLRRLANPSFDPRQLALVEVPLALPEAARGTAHIGLDLPNRVELELDMATPGLVILADRWAPGWRARLDGKPVEVLRVNHALRGALVPAGKHHLAFDYWPRSFEIGLWLAGLGLLLLLSWVATTKPNPFRPPGVTPAPSS